MAETMNMKSVSVEKFANLVGEQIEDEDFSPIIGIGKAGVGKTVSIYEKTVELGIGFCELRLVNLSETDLLGLPQAVNGRTTYASNDLLPYVERDGEVGILVLDEITSARESVRALSLQLLDSKRGVGNYKLPPKWLVVSLGNGIEDGGIFNGLESAVLNRCRCWRVEPDLQSWKHWATKNDIESSVVGFVSWDPNYLHTMVEDDVAGVFASPRSWEALSKKLRDREKRKGGKLDEESVELYASACVGEKVAVQFSAFYNYSKGVLSADEIIAGVAPTDLRNYAKEAQYLVASSLTKRIAALVREANLREQEEIPRGSLLGKQLGNTLSWIADVSKNTSLDLALMCFSDLNENIPELENVILSSWIEEDYPRFIDFITENVKMY